MNRRLFIRNGSLAGGAFILPGAALMAGVGAPFKDGPTAAAEPGFKAMRWAQLAFVENDPGRFDPDFWLHYFKRIHADGALLSAGGVVAFYPTQVPFHHRSDWLGQTDPLDYMVKGCRSMNMSVILRTDPHATRQDMYDAHPDYISVTADGQKRRHWANPALWVTCAYGPYNFGFMTEVHKEIMDRFAPDGIFSNRWAGHGICYCEHCKTNFKKASGLDLPKAEKKLDPVYIKWQEWRTARLRELWFLWDGEIRKKKSAARFIPNGFPDKLETGKYADVFFADQQARRGVIPPWSNAMGAKSLRAGMGMKPIINIFSVGVEEEYRWKDSVQSDAELRIWIAEAVAGGMRPSFVKFGAYIYDKRWMNTIEKLYGGYYKNERYLQNIAPLARIGLVYSEQTDQKYGGKPWQERSNEHALGMYHALVEAHMPFEMVNDKLLAGEHLLPFKLLILPNIAALSDMQCDQLRKFVEGGGSLIASFETSLYNEEGQPRPNFGLTDLLGVSFDGGVEGPMHNSYLRLKTDPGTGQFHPVLNGLEEAYKIVNSVYRVKVKPGNTSFPSPVTLIPQYPDLPMEDVYPRVEDTDIRELYLRDFAAPGMGDSSAFGKHDSGGPGKGRVAYIPGDLDRSFWQMLSLDHGRLLGNIIRWTLGEESILQITSPGVIDTAVWRQKDSMTVHLVNLSNPMMMKGPFRELIPVRAQVRIKIPDLAKVKNVHLLMSDTKPSVETKDGALLVQVPEILDHEIIALDFV